MVKKLIFRVIGAVFALAGVLETWGQTQDSITAATVKLEEVQVKALFAQPATPLSFSNVDKEEIAKRNLGQDLPVLLNYLPSVVTTSDAGSGVGYTGIRVRGSDATRVNITINGIPYNDAESQGTFWVDLPDFASSIENLQLQRGVGTSTNGAGAFGASLHLQTDNISEKAAAEVTNSFGSFNTRKHNVKFSTGLLRNIFEFSGRLSLIKSNGYVDRATSDLRSFFLQANWKDEKNHIRALAFGGHEITYQSWFGIDAITLESNRTYNPAGIQFDSQGNFEGFYSKQVDNYKQDHYQLHFSREFNERWQGTLAFHYTHGRGFFEEFIDEWYYNNVLFAPDATLAFLDLPEITVNGQTIGSTDNIRRRWLDNDFFGTTFSLSYKKQKLQMVLGGAWNKYIGDHFGELLYVQYSQNQAPFTRLYESTARKTDFNSYAKLVYQLSSRWQLYADMQFRAVNYKTAGNLLGRIPIDVDKQFSFFNPKAGITYQTNSSNFYISWARANKEPNRNDFENGNPKPERLDDFELGWRLNKLHWSFSSNLYFMNYRNQLVLSGGIDNSGFPIRTNSGSSYRMGLEMDAAINLSNKWRIKPNVAWSINRNRDFVFQRDGVLENLGSTRISYSPEMVIGNAFDWSPTKNVTLSFLSKYVGKQYMANIDSENSKLESWFTNDVVLFWVIKPKAVFDSITVNVLVNNIFDREFISNGYYFTFDIDDSSSATGVRTLDGAGYYPQAGMNFLAGINLKF